MTSKSEKIEIEKLYEFIQCGICLDFYRLFFVSGIDWIGSFVGYLIESLVRSPDRPVLGSGQLSRRAGTSMPISEILILEIQTSIDVIVSACVLLWMPISAGIQK